MGRSDVARVPELPCIESLPDTYPADLACQGHVRRTRTREAVRFFQWIENVDREAIAWCSNVTIHQHLLQVSMLEEKEGQSVLLGNHKYGKVQVFAGWFR